ncbi:uncharacterized protein LOC133740991 isoform X2 [Rosa rugosa]|uniref:uncharacterized protein LOC133740991 isoform X2 n=1 Tax=Rosa rugosa TaxID=74645 RepID=UPI002B4066D2|nr:uncharacterized protein LOC133740991 isoform X2 [Rosa rugosa]
MEGDTVRSEHQAEEEEEYVLLDLDSVYSQLQIPPNAPYVLSGLDTMQPVLILDGKFKLVSRRTYEMIATYGIIFGMIASMVSYIGILDGIRSVSGMRQLGHVFYSKRKLSLLFTKKQDHQKQTFLLANALLIKSNLQASK